MSHVDTAGYPVHAVRTYSQHVTEHQVTVTTWHAACGASDTKVGLNPFGDVMSARRGELCRACWPAGHRTYHPGTVRKDSE